MYEELHKLDELSRRKFLQYCQSPLRGRPLFCRAKASLGLGRESPCQYKNVIYVFLQEGMSQIDTFDRKRWAQQGPLKRLRAVRWYFSLTSITQFSTAYG